MTSRAYGQYCGLSRALELIGERWTLLIIRDLLIGPKRFTDLRRDLPGIPSNILTTRLKELEHAALIQRRTLPRPEKTFVYELTAEGRELDDVILALSRWGAQRLDAPREHEVITTDSLATALRTTFQPDATRELQASFELHLGDVVVHATVDHGALQVGRGPLPQVNLIIHTGPAIKDLMSGEVSPEEALTAGDIQIEGPSELLSLFARAFRIVKQQ